VSSHESSGPDDAFSREIAYLLDELPELRPVYDTEADYWKAEGFPGFHTVAADVILPFLLERLADTEGPQELLARLGTYLEYMANSPGLLREALALSVLDSLRQDPRLLRRAMPHLGISTRRVLGNLERQ
jgi:hypothetical protein